MARKPAPGARDRVLDVAGRLFYENGVHSVGLQHVIDECACGKNLLYREFASKDDLVVAWLERCRDESVEKMDVAIQPFEGQPAKQLVALVQHVADGVVEPGFRGCALRNTHAEFPDANHPAHRVAVDYVKSLRARLLALARQAGARDPDELADRLMLILDGLITNGAVFGNRGAAKAAVAFADDIVTAAVPHQRSSTKARARTR